MINLLPPDEKKNLRAARSNSLLMRYVFLFFTTLVVMSLVFGASYYLLSTEKSAAEAKIAENSQTEKQYANTKKSADIFRNNLSSAKSILSKRIEYTRILLDLAKNTPPNTILTNVSLDPTMIGKPVTIQAQAKSYNDAVALRQKLLESGMFSDVHFESIATLDGATYSQNVAISVTFKKEAIQS